MTIIRQFFRLSGIAFLSCGYMTGSMAFAISTRQPWKRRQRLARNISFWCRLILKVLNIKVHTEDFAPLKDNCLLISNHQSYLDILVEASFISSCYVTSREIKETPFLGHICQLAGCLYVERRKPSRLRTEVAEIAEALKSGLSVTIFPEATSTNGEALLRFRRPLFQTAVLSGKEIRPLVLRYEKLGGHEVCVENRDAVCWYGDMPFFSHFWKFLGIPETHVRLKFLPAISVRDKDATMLAEETYAAISAHYRPYLSDSNQNQILLTTLGDTSCAPQQGSSNSRH